MLGTRPIQLLSVTLSQPALVVFGLGVLTLSPRSTLDIIGAPYPRKGGRSRRFLTTTFVSALYTIIRPNLLSAAIKWHERQDGRLAINSCPSGCGNIANPFPRVGYGARLRLHLTQFPGHESGVGSSPTLVKSFFAVSRSGFSGVGGVDLLTLNKKKSCHSAVDGGWINGKPTWEKGQFRKIFTPPSTTILTPIFARFGISDQKYSDGSRSFLGRLLFLSKNRPNSQKFSQILNSQRIV